MVSAERYAPKWQAVELAQPADRAGADADQDNSSVAIHLSVARPYARDGGHSVRSPTSPHPANAAAPLLSRATHAVCQDSRAADSCPAQATHLAEVPVGRYALYGRPGWYAPPDRSSPHAPP